MRSFVTGLSYWGVALIVSDLCRHCAAGTAAQALFALAHVPLVGALGLMALPEAEVRDYYPFGSILAELVKAAQHALASRIPCLASPASSAVLAIYVGLVHYPRAAWARPDASFLGPLERLDEFRFLWPAYVVLCVAYGVIYLAVLFTRHWLAPALGVLLAFGGKAPVLVEATTAAAPPASEPAPRQGGGAPAAQPLAPAAPLQQQPPLAREGAGLPQRGSPPPRADTPPPAPARASGAQAPRLRASAGAASAREA